MFWVAGTSVPGVQGLGIRAEGDEGYGWQDVV